MKRAFDILFSASVLLFVSPLIFTALALVWLHDRHSPIYRARRVGLNDQDFYMIKVRSMTINADKTGVNSTSAGDARVTPIGRYIRRLKLDELSQFWNVLKGDMSVVGPRPNTRAWGVDLYTNEERRLLSVRPGITDLASVVFSDEGEILAGAENADKRYNEIIRPWKSRLGLLYIQKMSIVLDLNIIWLTFLAILSKQHALKGVHKTLRHLNADDTLVRVCMRIGPLPGALPPGAEDRTRQGNG